MKPTHFSVENYRSSVKAQLLRFDTPVLRALQRIEETMVTKQQLLEMLETIALLSNTDTMRQIAASEKNIRAGKNKPIARVSQL